MKYILLMDRKETTYDDWNLVLEAGKSLQNYSSSIIIFNEKSDVLVTFHKLPLYKKEP